MASSILKASNQEFFFFPDVSLVLGRLNDTGDFTEFLWYWCLNGIIVRCSSDYQSVHIHFLLGFGVTYLLGGLFEESISWLLLQKVMEQEPAFCPPIKRFVILNN